MPINFADPLCLPDDEVPVLYASDQESCPRTKPDRNRSNSEGMSLNGSLGGVNTVMRSRNELPPRNEPSAGDLLVEAIADAVARRLERLASTQQRLMDIHDAAKYLGLTEPALRQKAGIEIPCIRTDGRLRFDRRDLDRYIDQAPGEGV